MAVVRIDPSRKFTPNVGEILTLDIKIADGLGIHTIRGEVEYDNDLVSFIGGFYGNFLNAAGTPRDTGTTALIDIDDDNNPATRGGGTVASLNFRVIHKQELEFDIRNFTAEDENGIVNISEEPGVTFENPVNIDFEKLLEDADIPQTIPVVQDPTPLTENTLIPSPQDTQSTEVALTEHLLSVIEDRHELIRLYTGDDDDGQPIKWEWETNDFPLPDNYTVVSAVYVMHSGRPTEMRLQVFVEGKKVEDSMFTPSKSNRFYKGIHARGNQLKVIVSGVGEPPPISQIDIEYN